MLIDDVVWIVLRAIYWVLMPAVLLRLYMQARRIPMRNAVGRFVFTVTDWIVVPLRRVLPGLRGFDWASLLAALLIELAQRLLFDLLTGRMAIFKGAMLPWLMSSGFGFLSAIVVVAMVCVIAYAVISWVRTDSEIGDVLEALVNPLLRPLRRRMPMVGGFDLSPLVLIVALQVLSVILDHSQATVAATLFPRR
ncbi:MAG: YggT family protein [Burkholderiales bacterium]